MALALCARRHRLHAGVAALLGVFAWVDMRRKLHIAGTCTVCPSPGGYAPRIHIKVALALCARRHRRSDSGPELTMNFLKVALALCARRHKHPDSGPELVNVSMLESVP